MISKFKRLQKAKKISKELSEYRPDSKCIQKNHLIIIRLDDIGDYVLFRNALENIRTSGKFRNWKITLIGNLVWKELCLKLDNAFFDESLWIDKKQYFHSPGFRKELARHLNELGAELVWIPARTRHFFLEDCLASLIPAEKIVTSGNSFSQYPSKIERNFIESLGYEPIEVFENFHDWEFNKEVCFRFSGSTRKHNFLFPALEPYQPELKKPYVVLFPGGSAGSKRWPAQGFTRLAKNIFQHFSGMRIVLAGSEADSMLANQIEDGAKLEKGAVLNLTGKTNLYELCQVLAGAEVLISNDTSAAHMAALLKIPVVVPANGNKYGRFFPYPSTFEKVKAIYPPDSLKNLPFNFQGQFSIRTIGEGVVFKAVADLLNEEK